LLQPNSIVETGLVPTQLNKEPAWCHSRRESKGTVTRESAVVSSGEEGKWRKVSRQASRSAVKTKRIDHELRAPGRVIQEENKECIAGEEVRRVSRT